MSMRDLGTEVTHCGARGTLCGSVSSTVTTTTPTLVNGDRHIASGDEIADKAASSNIVQAIIPSSSIEAYIPPILPPRDVPPSLPKAVYEDAVDTASHSVTHSIGSGNTKRKPPLLVAATASCPCPNSGASSGPENQDQGNAFSRMHTKKETNLFLLRLSGTMGRLEADNEDESDKLCIDEHAVSQEECENSLALSPDLPPPSPPPAVHGSRVEVAQATEMPRKKSSLPCLSPGTSDEGYFSGTLDHLLPFSNFLKSFSDSDLKATRGGRDEADTEVGYIPLDCAGVDPNEVKCDAEESSCVVVERQVLMESKDYESDSLTDIPVSLVINRDLTTTDCSGDPKPILTTTLHVKAKPAYSSDAKVSISPTLAKNKDLYQTSSLKPVKKESCKISCNHFSNESESYDSESCRISSPSHSSKHNGLQVSSTNATSCTNYIHLCSFSG